MMSLLVTLVCILAGLAAYHLATGLLDTQLAAALAYAASP